MKKSQKTNYETGWVTISWIEIKSLSNYSFIDNFVCNASKYKLEEESLFVERKNFMHRGNETDELICYNRATTPIEFKSVWDKWDLRKESKKNKIIDIANRYNIKI